MIEKLKKYDLCIGCGLCEAVFGKGKAEMRLTDRGFYFPEFTSNLTVEETERMKSFCPAVHVETEQNTGLWGSLKRIGEAWSTDDNIRHKAASGGAMTALAIYLLESHEVDAVLQVGVRDDSYLYNVLKVSHSRDEVIRNAQSRYAPALVFPHIKTFFEQSSETFAFIGKPCDIAGMRNFLRLYPAYAPRVKFFLSIFCAGAPSYNATKKTWQLSGHIDEPVALKYRGDGWPGNFVAKFADGTHFEMSYNESWGKILGRTVGFRCKICPDGIGMLSDISLGDSWNTKNGYPDFTEAEGRCFCMVRTDRGIGLIERATAAGYLSFVPMEVGKVQEQQAYQARRRRLTGWRLLPVQLLTNRLLHFKGLGLTRLAFTINPWSALKETLGTWRRLRKLR